MNEIINNDTWAKRFSSWGALSVTGAIFFLLGIGVLFSYWSADPPPAFSNLMETVKALSMMAAAYWLGSSNSSQKKDDVLASNAVALANSTPNIPPGTTTVTTTPETKTIKVEPEIIKE